jgi:hypothetical protein
VLLRCYSARVRICVALLALAACKPEGTGDKLSPQPQPQAPRGDAPVESDGSQCPQQPFALSTPLPEASGAAWLVIDGTLGLVVVADSGHDGAYVVLDPETGETGEQGRLPLAKLSDDIEGLAGRDDKLYGLTSSGLMRVWRRKNAGFELVDGPYPIGTEADKTVCPPRGRCPINYEGLALAPSPQGSCAGFACSKGDGHLYCLVERDGRFAVDLQQPRIAVARPGVLGDCAFSDTGTLWVGNNAFGLNEVYRVDGWADPATARVVSVNAFGIGFPEVIAARGDVIYRMSDTGGSPSLMAKFRCLANPR